jgi:hypothetical protein
MEFPPIQEIGASHNLATMLSRIKAIIQCHRQKEFQVHKTMFDSTANEI